MTTYSAIAGTELDADSPVTDTLMARLDANPRAVSEMDATAVSAGAFMANGWQNHDGTSGLTAVYDSAVNGTVATITTPDFEDGFEYRLFGRLSTGAAMTLQAKAYRATSAAYSAAFTVGVSATSDPVHFDMDVRLPRAVLSSHMLRCEYVAASGNGETAATGQSTVVSHGTAQKLLRLQFLPSSGSISTGQLYMLRRGEYATR